MKCTPPASAPAQPQTRGMSRFKGSRSKDAPEARTIFRTEAKTRWAQNHLHRTAGPSLLRAVGGGKRASSAAALPSGGRPLSRGVHLVQDKDKTRGISKDTKQPFSELS
jgi:hypothetical protein